MKARWSKYLQKQVYECSRVFFLENHADRRETSTLNGKLERTKMPKIMTPTDCLRAYD